MKKVKFLIIGAGVSGLGFANFIESDDYLIIEKQLSAGGYCKTIKKDEFIWDYAGHFFHFSNPIIKKFFESKIAKNDLIQRKKITKIYYNGNFIDYPFQKNIHQLEKKEFIECLYDLFNRKQNYEFNNFQEMLYTKFGKSITEKFLKPYNEKLYACSLLSLDKDAMGRFFPYAKLEDVINNFKVTEDNSYNQEFSYPKQGAVTFVNALLKDIPTSKIQYNEELVKIDIENKIAYTKNEEYSFEILVNTTPLKQFLRHANENDVLIDSLTSNKVLVLNIGFDKPSIQKDIHWLYVPDKTTNFYRIGFYNNILGTENLSIYVEIGYSSDEKIDIQKSLDDTIINLKKMGIIDDHKIKAYENIIMNPAYVHITDLSNKIKEIRKLEFSSHNIYTIGRYGDWKYCSIEDSINDARVLADKFNSIQSNSKA